MSLWLLQSIKGPDLLAGIQYGSIVISPYNKMHAEGTSMDGWKFMICFFNNLDWEADRSGGIGNEGNDDARNDTRKKRFAFWSFEVASQPNRSHNVSRDAHSCISSQPTHSHSASHPSQQHGASHPLLSHEFSQLALPANVSEPYLACSTLRPQAQPAQAQPVQSQRSQPQPIQPQKEDNFE
ncbi:hypothetical protein RHMOL_Rhmol12G0075700 [Rhododendron molle]|uniref:Uncharacterized protein n=1 Tax=Rhododendron molle TaxID=49168 RepID=A0ACC0LFJ5_RHOML|nr:hypothetical protein RHMOL_Rhmol12G0075700 [Rhododendron molle]